MKAIPRRLAGRPLAVALLLVAACRDAEEAGGLSREEDQRLNAAGELLDEPEARFEDREVDDAPSDEEDAKGQALEDTPDE